MRTLPDCRPKIIAPVRIVMKCIADRSKTLIEPEALRRSSRGLSPEGAEWPRNDRGTSAGFSLLELLVAVSIVIALSGMSVVGYSRFQERQSAQAAAYQLATDLRDAQQKALSGQKPSGWCATGTLSTWRLVFTGAAPSSTYQILSVCSDASTRLDRTGTLPNSAVSPSLTSVDFAVLTGATTAGATVTFTVRRTVASATYTYTIQVNQAGAVTVL